MILRLRHEVTSENYLKNRGRLTKEFNQKIVLLPNDIEIVNIYEIKEVDIKITGIDLETESTYCDSEMVDNILLGTKVNFLFKDINANLFIESNKLLTVKEMKREIINRFSIKEINVKEDM